MRRRFGQHFPGVSALRIHLDTLGSRLPTCLPAEDPGGSDFGGSEGDACLEPSRCAGAALRAPVELQVCSAPSVFLRPGSWPRVPAQGPGSGSPPRVPRLRRAGRTRAVLTEHALHEGSQRPRGPVFSPCHCPVTGPELTREGPWTCRDRVRPS